MAKTKKQKENAVKNLTEKLAKMKSVVLSDYNGLKVKEMEELRKTLKKSGNEYVVAKKTLLDRALKEKKLPLISEMSGTGGFGLALGYEDEVSAAKIIAKFSKSHPAMKIHGGILEGKLITMDKVMELAKLPSKQELIAKVVGSIAAPLSGFINVLQGNLCGLVCVLDAIKDKK